MKKKRPKKVPQKKGKRKPKNTHDTKEAPRKKPAKKKVTTIKQLIYILDTCGSLNPALLKSAGIKATQGQIRDALHGDRELGEELRERVWKMGGSWNHKQSPAHEKRIRDQKKQEELAQLDIDPTYIPPLEEGTETTTKSKTVSSQDRPQQIIDMLKNNPMTGAAIRDELGLQAISSVMGQLEREGKITSHIEPGQRGKVWSLSTPKKRKKK